MIEKICNFLLKKIRNKMPEIDDERAEAINFGLQLLIGEIPKTFILLAIAYCLGILELSVVAFLLILPYRSFSGGFHLKTHIGCVLGTSIFYCATVILSKNINIEPINVKYILTFIVWIFSIIMIKLYAPADTENVPIISKKLRKQKKVLSYISMTISLILSVFIPSTVISNILLYGIFFQTLTITRLAYKLTNNKYGYELYK